jgi:hypothetical protein
MVANYMIFGAAKLVPDTHETLIFRNRDAEIAHLHDEINLFCLHILDEST